RAVSILYIVRTITYLHKMRKFEFLALMVCSLAAISAERSHELPLCKDVPKGECGPPECVHDPTGNETCHTRCSTIPCRNAPRDCNDDSFWAKKIKGERPEAWSTTTEKSANWEGDQKNMVLVALNRLPTLFKTKSLFGIYRMKSSIQ